jgi:hypothetical protein
MTITPHKTVILRHELPDQSVHFDWMIDQPSLTCEHRLFTWSCQIRPDCLHTDHDGISKGFFALQLPDHRAHYLTYEGLISKNRGSVTRVATGLVKKFTVAEESIILSVQWDKSTLTYSAHLNDPESRSWRISQS